MDPISWEGQLPGAHLTPGISLGGGQARTHKGLALKQKPATGLPIGREGGGARGTFVNTSSAWTPETKHLAADGSLCKQPETYFSLLSDKRPAGDPSLSPDSLPHTEQGLPLHITSVTS